VFIGTFDTRKGASEFPKIVANICSAVPGATFRLLGTGRKVDQILSNFSKPLRNRIDVIPHFPSDDLPRLLADCAVGIFPSYMEGFGLGVLEMLAASIPVIAYDSPGPSGIVSREFLVPRGDWPALCRKVVHLLRNVSELAESRKWAKVRAANFSWESSATQTSETYIKHWQAKRSLKSA
jgi:glycosyltransferase involved in cell wall biosynthesis